MQTRPFAILAIALAAAAAQAQGPEIRPGLWEFSLAGSGGKGMTQQVCFSPQMVQDMKGLAARGDPSSDCKASNEKVAGATRSFDVACTRPSAYNARVSITVEGPDRFTMRQDFTVEQGGQKQQGSLSFSYRRVGECRK
jgi:hypothetical protein